MATIIARDDADKQIIYAVGANYASNEYIPDGNKGGISLNDVTSGSDATVQARCVVEGFAKPAGQTWDEGQYLYFDPVAKTATSVEQADGLFRFKAYKSALIAATTGDIEVIEPIFDDLIDADEIAYDNSTSALAATNVQDAIDEFEARVDDLEADKMDLVATPAAGNLIEMDAAGQGFDSGIATADVQVLTVPAAADNLAGLNAAGALTDSGIAAADVQVLAVPTAAGNIATLDAAGAIQDSTIPSASIAAAITMGTIYLDQVRNSTNTAQAVADTTPTGIALEDVDLAGNITVDVTNKIFTIPAGATGAYLCYVSLTFEGNAGGTDRVAELHVNGSASGIVGSEAPDGVNPVTAIDSGVLVLTAADAITVVAFHDAGAPLNVTTGQLMLQRIQ